MWRLTLHSEIMTRSLGRISTALMLLAAILSPLQQSWAATTTCCCSRNSDTSRAVTAYSHSNCCLERAFICHGLGDSVECSCCQYSQQDSSSAPCRCPADCSGNALPHAVDPASAQLFSTDEMAGVAVVAFLTFATHQISDASSGDSTLLYGPSGGAALCVLLCCYRL